MRCDVRSCVCCELMRCVTWVGVPTVPFDKVYSLMYVNKLIKSMLGLDMVRLGLVWLGVASFGFGLVWRRLV